ncbi:MAG: hypothetical protein RMJ53_02525 [Chitinophagales bacterium]|nr:hypothetical protein [Chitinophagales bacterium]
MIWDEFPDLDISWNKLTDFDFRTVNYFSNLNIRSWNKFSDFNFRAVNYFPDFNVLGDKFSNAVQFLEGFIVQLSFFIKYGNDVLKSQVVPD